MTLSPAEFDRMKFLLGKANSAGLSSQEEQELRDLVQRQNPSANTSDIGSLIAAGALIIGLVALLAAISKK